MESIDAIFDETRFSSIPRPKDITQDIVPLIEPQDKNHEDTSIQDDLLSHDVFHDEER